MKEMASIILFILISFNGICQDCICNKDQTIKLCYQQRDVYCDQYDGLLGINCGLTFEHITFTSFEKKITNEFNFGNEGIIRNGIELIPIASVNLEQIDSLCNIFFIGNFPIDSLTDKLDYSKTLIDDETISTIYNWSKKCPSNMVLVSQAEAWRWGYVFQNDNKNPNTPSSFGLPKFSIFNGPFGEVRDFGQGGGYQGVLKDKQHTNFTVLSSDSLDRPTILLDHITSDIILGDIGFFISGSAGFISEGEGITNSNDKLVSNIIGLAVNLSSNYVIDFSSEIICSYGSQCEPLILSATEDIDTLISHNTLCDTISILRKEPYESNEFYSLCEDSIVIINQVGETEIELELPDDVLIEWTPRLGLSNYTNKDVIVDGSILEYTLLLSPEENNSCSITKNIILTKNKRPYVSNIICSHCQSPNDQFIVRFNDERTIVEELSIYDRFGSKVFNAKEFNPFTSEKASKFSASKYMIGVYLVHLKVTYPNGEKASYVSTLSSI